VLPYDTLLVRYEVQTSGDPGWSWPDNHVQALTSEGMFGDEVVITVGPEKAYIFIPGLLFDWESARLTIDKDANPTTINTNPGQEVVYSVTVRNEGNTSGTLLTVEDTLPNGFTYLDMEPGSEVQADPDATTGTITWTGPWDMWPGRELTFIYRVDGPDTEGTYTNYANLTAEGARVPAGPAWAEVTVERGILMEDNFNDPGIGIGRWTEFLNYKYRLRPGQWYWGEHDGPDGSGAATQDAYRVDGKEAEDALLMYLADGAEDWTDYRLEANIILRTDNYPQGLWVRGQYKDVGDDDPGGWVTGYYIMVGGNKNKDRHYVSLKQLQTLTDCWDNACNNPENLYDFNNPHELTITKKDGTLERYQWHTLVVEVRGANIKVWFNGDQYIDYNDTKEPFLTGTVGLKTFKADTVSFDNVVVTPLD
jgi:uncharacterized repeat protein (TIGR01451 family)